MTTVVRISQDDERLDAASRWILKMAEGLSSAERQSLEAWLSEHPKNGAELVDVAKAWDKLDSLTRLADLFPIEHANTVVSKRRLHLPDSGWLPAAASVLAIATAALLLALSVDMEGLVGDQTMAVRGASYETTIGEQLIVDLADGTVLSLNTNSQVNVNYSESARVLRLSRGEIHIQVAHETNRPLFVVAEDRVVQAVGTAFRVEIMEDQRMGLMVTEGKVVVGMRLKSDNKLSGKPIPVPPILAESETKAVAAGEELVLGAPEEIVVPVSAEEIEVKLSWREGRLIFRSEPLERALAEVERYTTVEFVFMDEKLKSRSLSGRYRTGDVEALLLALEANFGIRYEYAGEDRVLLSSL